MRVLRRRVWTRMVRMVMMVGMSGWMMWWSLTTRVRRVMWLVFTFRGSRSANSASPPPRVNHQPSKRQSRRYPAMSGYFGLRVSAPQPCGGASRRRVTGTLRGLATALRHCQEIVHIKAALNFDDTTTTTSTQHTQTHIHRVLNQEPPHHPSHNAPPNYRHDHHPGHPG